MKKLVCVALLLSMCFLFGCSSVDSKPSADEKNELENTSQNINLNEDVILPKVNVKSTNLAKEFKNLNLNNFTIVNAIGNTCKSRMLRFDGLFVIYYIFLYNLRPNST